MPNTAQPWEGQPPAGYGPIGPRPPKRGPSLATAIIAAAVLLGAALIAAAIVFASGNKSSTPTAAPSRPAAAPANAADSSTCNAWRSTKSALDNAGDPLPADWNWNTPGIDEKIAQSNAIITNAMNLFEPQIADEPADVATAAHAYVKARRAEVAKFANHTFTEADGVPVNSAFATLNQLCNVAG